VRSAIDLLGSGAIAVGNWLIDVPLSEGAIWFDRLVGDPGPVAKALLVP